MSLRGWLDSSPLASVALALMRDATGRERPLEPLAPTRAAALAPGSIVACWSLAAGAGASTVAALIAHRSAAGGVSPLLVDLDRWVPSLGLRARIESATVADVLLRPGRERESISRWSGVAFLPAAPGLHRVLDERVIQLVERAAAGAPAVLDLGAGADALDPGILAALGHLLLVTGTSVAQLQAAFCAVSLLREAPCAVGLVVVGAAPDDAAAVAARLPWQLRGAIPTDPFLAADAFAARAPTLRAVDGLIRALR